MMDPNWERYSRQILFAPLGEAGQQRLAAARVAIVGCGALGSAQAESLARAGVGRLRLIDRDFVETSNLQRQSLFDESDAQARLPKAVAAQVRLQRINSAVEVEARVADLTPSNAASLLDGCDLLLDGSDNYETRYLVNDFAVAHGVPWIYGAAVASRGATFTVRPGVTACLRCLFPEPPVGAGETCDTTGVLGWVVAWAAALQVAEAVKLLTGNEAALRTSLLSADLWTNHIQELAAPRRDPDCAACARRDFAFLRGEARAVVTLCGRNTVQIHEHDRPLALDQLAQRLRPHGEVRANEFALRFLPRGILASAQPERSAGLGQGGPQAGASISGTRGKTAQGPAPSIEMMIFPDGRALIKGTDDPGLARSLYARFIGS